MRTDDLFRALSRKNVKYYLLVKISLCELYLILILSEDWDLSSICFFSLFLLASSIPHSYIFPDCIVLTVQIVVMYRKEVQKFFSGK